MAFSLPFGGEGALLTALHYSAVRSRQAIETAGFPLLIRAEGRTHRLSIDGINYAEERCRTFVP